MNVLRVAEGLVAPSDIGRHRRDGVTSLEERVEAEDVRRARARTCRPRATLSMTESGLITRPNTENERLARSERYSISKRHGPKLRW